MGSDNTSRIALLSLGPATEMSPNRRHVGGASILERQVDVALALGCRRIWLSAPELDGLALRAQRLAEAGGAQFRLLQRGRQLLGSLRQQDELLVLAEGLLPGDVAALDLLNSGASILCVSAASGMAAGFERLDRERCWAGGMILPGRVIERLDELGEDIEPVSALLRAGRAARVAERAVPVEWLAEGRWTLTPQRVPVGSGSAPARTASLQEEFVSRPAGALLADRPRMAVGTAVAGGLATIGSMAALIWALPAVSLLLVALAGVLLASWVSSRRLGDVRVFSAVPRGRWEGLLPVLAEPVAAAALVAGLHTQFGWSSTLYVTILTLSTWVLAGMGSHRHTSIFKDRTLLWALTAAGGLAGAWIVGPALASALSLGGIMLNMRKQPAITRA